MDSVTKQAPFDILEVSGIDPLKDGATIAQAGEVLRGSVLGKVTASGELKLLDTASSDGSEKPFAVLYDSVDTTDEAKVGNVYLQGSFNKDALIFGGSTTVDDVWDDMRVLNLIAFDTTVVTSI